MKQKIHLGFALLLAAAIAAYILFLNYQIIEKVSENQRWRNRAEYLESVICSQHLQVEGDDCYVSGSFFMLRECEGPVLTLKLDNSLGEIMLEVGE